MTKADMGQRQLAAASGISEDTIRKWRQSRYLPSLHYAAQIASTLGAPQILRHVKEQRTRLCAYCGGEFIAAKDRHKRFCSHRCISRRSQARHRPTRDGEHRRFLVFDLKAHKTAVAAFCDSCEPEGICRWLECPLRSVSPLPYSPLRW